MTRPLSSAKSVDGSKVDLVDAAFVGLDTTKQKKRLEPVELSEDMTTMPWVRAEHLPMQSSDRSIC